jgi:hypothetical protein
LPEAVSVTVHDTFHLLGVFQCSELFFGCVPMFRVANREL